MSSQSVNSQTYSGNVFNQVVIRDSSDWTKYKKQALIYEEETANSGSGNATTFPATESLGNNYRLDKLQGQLKCFCPTYVPPYVPIFNTYVWAFFYIPGDVISPFAITGVGSTDTNNVIQVTNGDGVLGYAGGDPTLFEISTDGFSSVEYKNFPRLSGTNAYSGCAYNSATGRLLMCDTLSNSVFYTDRVISPYYYSGPPNDQSLTAIFDTTTPINGGSKTEPFAICTSVTSVYVTDLNPSNSRIITFNIGNNTAPNPPNITNLTEFRGIGTHYSTAITSTSSYVYTADYDGVNTTFWKLDVSTPSNDAIIGFAPGVLSYGIAIDSSTSTTGWEGNLVFADSISGVLFNLFKDGSFASVVTQFPPNPNLGAVGGIFIDSNSNIYICNPSDGVISKLTKQ